MTDNLKERIVEGGRKGGNATSKKYGLEYMHMIARKGGKKGKKKLSTPLPESA